MRNTTKSALFVTSLAVVAGAAVAFGYVWHVPGEGSPVARTTAQPSPAQETVGVAQLRSLGRPTNGDITPTFDIVRIEPGGDAVIAGRSAPGATVELLRDGVIQDKATTDSAGHFVMLPPRLPPGRYELTLVAVQPDGKQLTSQRSVPVALPPSETK
jgi:hypothetical protein